MAFYTTCRGFTLASILVRNRVFPDLGMCACKDLISLNLWRNDKKERSSEQTK